MEGVYCVYVLAGICAAVVFSTTALSRMIFKAPKLDHIPTVGSTTLWGPYWSALRFSFDRTAVIQQGYTKYKTSCAFKVATATSWLVILNRNHADDIIKSSEDTLSLGEAMADYTMGPEIDRSHISIIRYQLTRNLDRLYPKIRDEIVTSFTDLMDPKDEWKAVPLISTMRKIIFRTNHRIIVGLPLCRDPGWLDLNQAHMNNTVKEAFFLMLIPRIMIPIVAKYVTNLPRRVSTMVECLDPITTERQNRTNVNVSDQTDEPNDFLQWCLDKGKGASISQLAQHILSINLASLHTPPTVLAQALCHLAENPNYTQMLREEVDDVVSIYGWTKEAIVKMKIMDSFLKETLRIGSFTTLSGKRKAMRDVTLTDGTFIPKGAIICFPAHAIHHDNEIYENPGIFNPLRFVDRQDKDDQGNNTRNQLVAVSAESLGFGLGRSACPGRFFAALTLKSMLAHIVLTYDVKLEENGTPPRSQHIGTNIQPNPSTMIMFRKRQK